VTNKTVKTLGRINENLQAKIIKSDRPQLVLANTKIMGRNLQEKISSIDFTFINQGKRSATNVFGKMYVSYSDTTWDTGTLSVSRSDIFPNNRGFVLHQPMKFEPDVATYEKPICYYFRLTYSDILLDTLYNFEIAMKVSPALTTELIMCKEWEVDRIRKVLKLK